MDYIGIRMSSSGNDGGALQPKGPGAFYELHLRHVWRWVPHGGGRKINSISESLELGQNK